MRLDSRRRAAILGGLVALFLVAALVTVDRLVDVEADGRGQGVDDQTGLASIGIQGATQAARTACRWFEVDFPGHIAADAPADEVVGGLAQARSLADQAAAVDPAWVGLAGGLGALDEALRTDDPAAAEVAIRVLQTQCGGQQGAPS